MLQLFGSLAAPCKKIRVDWTSRHGSIYTLLGMTNDVPLLDTLEARHVGPSQDDQQAMLAELGYASTRSLVDDTIPEDIRLGRDLDLPPALTESEALQHLSNLAGQNTTLESWYGQGYHPCITPPVIRRNLIENPQWYTPYTPYQPEISQGRLELLLHFQTLVADLSGLPVANASLLDEATACAEAMTLCHRMLKRKDDRHTFFVADTVHPQNLAVLQTRAAPLGIELVSGDPAETSPDASWFGALIQVPDTFGSVAEHTQAAAFAEALHAHNARLVVASDPLALCLLPAPGSWGADVVVGSTQRLGMPMGSGGPHAAWLATSEACQRQLPGRIVGISKDVEGRSAYRLSLQTREQHIRRDKATSNICTAQALPAMVAAATAIYHGPERLRAIAARVHHLARLAAANFAKSGHAVAPGFFDTLTVETASDAVLEGEAYGHLVRSEKGRVSIACNETTTIEKLADLFGALGLPFDPELAPIESALPRREVPLLAQAIFSRHHSETELMRYLDRLQQKDLGLTDCMIPLGSCTMKLNAAAEMIPVTFEGFANIHPYAPAETTPGYDALCSELEDMLAEITGFAGVSLQPNAGSQGEYAGLLAIRNYHAARGEAHRDVCLIPLSAHGTNPASAIMCGLRVVGVKTDEEGSIDLEHLTAQIEAHRDQLAALMVTYPSTHGVFEETIREVSARVHEAGGQVYLDGANLNAMVGLCRPGDIGADVCHLNLHKTFCIPHGGGGPGMGPIGVVEHLVPHLPGPVGVADTESMRSGGAVSAAPVGSGCILPISYAYIRMMGAAGLRRATEVAILNANYIAHRLAPHFPVLYTGKSGRVAHECILDCRGLKEFGVDVEDIAKRLMDFGFHAPTMSWPVAGTLMVEPTESESRCELDRFCEAMIAIRSEAAAIEAGDIAAADSPLKFAPHTAEAVMSDTWERAYSRRQAAWPGGPDAEREGHKYWPPVARVDNVFGDRNLVCTCEPVAAYAEASEG